MRQDHKRILLDDDAAVRKAFVQLVTVLINDAPSAMTMLLRMLASSEVSRILNNSWCWSQNCELTQRNLLNDSIGAARSVGLCKQD